MTDKDGSNRQGDLPTEGHDAVVLAALADFVDAIKRAPISWETGVCCCGSPVDGHGFGDGHSPVDEGSYFIRGAIEAAEETIRKARTASAVGTERSEPKHSGNPMNTMLEQSARALAVAWYCRDDDDDETKAQAAEQWPGFTVLARAALQAIRVPDAGMIEAGESAAWDKGNSMPTIRAMPIGYTAMIDAILEEKPE